MGRNVREVQNICVCHAGSQRESEFFLWRNSYFLFYWFFVTKAGDCDAYGRLATVASQQWECATYNRRLVIMIIALRPCNSSRAPSGQVPFKHLPTYVTSMRAYLFEQCALLLVFY